jgi:hypothetical protein
MAMSKFAKSSTALPPSVSENPYSFCFQGEKSEKCLTTPPPFLFSKVKKMGKVDGYDTNNYSRVNLESLIDPDILASKYSRQSFIFKDGYPES